MELQKKKKGEDWMFSFFLQNENGVLVDLNGYKYSIVIEKKGGVEIFKEDGEITESAQELIKILPAIQTKDFIIGEYSIEYKIENTIGNTFITDKVSFECINTLHYN